MTAAECCRKTVAVLKIIVNILVILLSIAMIVMGAVYFNQCPKQNYIPIYMIVLGCTMLVMCIFCTLYLCVVSKHTVVMVAIVISIILALFNIAWMIAGSIWVFGIYNDHVKECPGKCYQYDMTATTTTESPTTQYPCEVLMEYRNREYCCPQIYLFSFVVTIVLWVFILITLLYEIYNMLLTAYKTCSGKIRNKEHVVTRSQI